MEKAVKSSGVSQGITLGVILSLITVIGYAVYQDLFTKWWMIFIQIGIPVTLGIIAGVKAKKLLGGFISFKSAFTAYFIAIALGTLISMLVSVVIFNFVDPDAAIAIKEKSIEVSVAMMERFGTPQEAIDQTITELEKQDTFGIGTQIKGWFIWMVVYIIIGLLASLAVKKKEPEY
ncbi:DUF4199 domain-containing protein [Aquimarina litoralis]|uniref:DUF4199 domain-containing protein n=1 Tax=Aquimarina litoralis TaxID=584605 RepID=UPI001C5700C6|nr:DUF4199 domain-containing protein [Aquimarina litoralis]MBW1295736.1 DUF4199 family protein [Aquimarina litoralis]